VTTGRFLVAAIAVWFVAEPGPAGAQALGRDAVIVVVEPDITLSRLSAAGQSRPRPDWSARARGHVETHVLGAIRSGGRQAHPVARAALPPDAIQILLLHKAVRATIRQTEDGDDALFTTSGPRVWTLGAGAGALAMEPGATHALIIAGDGDVTGAARAVFVVGAAAMGVLAGTGVQRASASLVDLRTGDIIWRNAIVASPEQDMRDPEGAHMLVTALLKGAPL
jgi:hypothetical protein